MLFDLIKIIFAKNFQDLWIQTRANQDNFSSSIKKKKKKKSDDALNILWILWGTQSRQNATYVKLVLQPPTLQNFHALMNGFLGILMHFKGYNKPLTAVC